MIWLDKIGHVDRVQHRLAWYCAWYIDWAVPLEICVRTDVFCATTSWDFSLSFREFESRPDFRDVLSSARSSRLCKRIAKILRLFYIWMKQIMSEPRTKFDCIENVKRKVASNPKLSFIVFSFLLTAFLVQLTLGIILVIKLGQESSETKGRYGFH